MKLQKFFIIIVLTTFLSLFYIQLQVKIYDMGYQGAYKKMEVQKLSDNNEYVTSEIMKLKSVNHLGVKLLNDSAHMQFLDGKHIVRLAVPSQILNENDFPMPSYHYKQEKKPRLLAGIFSLRSQAEAGPVR